MSDGRATHELVGDPCTALSLAVLHEAMKDQLGRRWIRAGGQVVRLWCLEAGLEHADLVNEADKRDGYGRRVA